MSLLSFCQWLQDTSAGVAIREGEWLFPIIETVHVLALAFSVGTIALVDLRLLGLNMRRHPVSDVLKQLQPWTLGGFSVMFVTGGLLFLSEAVKCYNSTYFRIKIVLLILAGVNAMLFHRTMFPQIAAWDLAPVAPPRARLAGGLSLVFWTGVIVAGRQMAYVR